jgi:hypothetical protein
MTKKAKRKAARKPRAPAGYVLVPIEASAAMMDAGVEAAGNAMPPKWAGAGRPGYGQIRCAWNAMLKAASSL